MRGPKRRDEQGIVDNAAGRMPFPHRVALLWGHQWQQTMQDAGTHGFARPRTANQNRGVMSNDCQTKAKPCIPLPIQVFEVHATLFIGSRFPSASFGEGHRGKDVMSFQVVNGFAKRGDGMQPNMRRDLQHLRPPVCGHQPFIDRLVFQHPTVPVWVSGNVSCQAEQSDAPHGSKPFDRHGARRSQKTQRQPQIQARLRVECRRRHEVPSHRTTWPVEFLFGEGLAQFDQQVFCGCTANAADVGLQAPIHAELDGHKGGRRARGRGRKRGDDHVKKG